MNVAEALSTVKSPSVTSSHAQPLLSSCATTPSRSVPCVGDSPFSAPPQAHFSHLRAHQLPSAPACAACALNCSWKTPHGVASQSRRCDAERRPHAFK